MKKKLIALLLLAAVVGSTGCAAQQASAPSANAPASTGGTAAQEKAELTIAAASSLTNAFTEMGEAFEAANGCTVTFSFGSTGTLSEQVTNGAPFDVFAAANESDVTALDEKGLLLSDTVQVYAMGRLGIATLKAGGFEAATMEDLTDPGIKVIAIANPEHAPYGLAAKQAMESAGLWETLEPKLVYGKNISETLSYLTTGNADAAFISLSLDDGETLDFHLVDADAHEPLRQAMAVVGNTGNEELARKFAEHVNSPQGQELMGRHGFMAPGE
ncbi:molybdate ABC transporter substrate-binding protein [Anaerotalea alkaliphila]|uniref:Molybdate ABC transporter substrate-binding protein n=1 Tax=Anaerotalea alkaliphila TaxID=2662126 RepID=A0A7X5HUA2_9FIRM|nr:molybdate ABC transporter substrate-binding protein [Anaerotalea alkaliphila]NDL66803.1 molybdate ABC transporter substrate-binding protein [Anaerotalea alkaliphila]